VVKKLNNQVIGVIDVRDVVKYIIFHLNRLKEDYLSKSQDLNKRKFSHRLIKNNIIENEDNTQENSFLNAFK